MITVKRAALILSGFVVVCILLFAAWCWLALNWSYSEGERAGYLQKFSRKGWICKTWEGELTLVTLPGVAPEKFAFTVRDEQVAAQLAADTGKRVVLAYAQHKGLPGSCFGDTEYFIDNVKDIQ